MGSVIAVAIAAAACAPKPTRPVDAPPAWRSEEGRVGVWRDMARWYIDNGMPDEALGMVDRLHEAGESNPELTAIRGRALAAQGVPDEARNLLEDLVRTAPRFADGWRALGVVYADLGEVDLAVDAFHRAEKLDPQDAATLNNLGFVLLGAGRCDEALPKLESAVENSGNQARYRNNLAFALVCVGQPERALKLFRTNLGEADAHYNMGVAFERAEAELRARSEYEAALDADPDHEKAAEALARLSPPDASPTPGDDR